MWSTCSVPCGFGRSRRSRACINGGVGEVGCLGEDDDIRGCFEGVSFWILALMLTRLYKWNENKHKRNENVENIRCSF